MDVPGFNEFVARLDSAGVRDGLVFLNKRTSHRFTSIYRYDGEILRNVVFVDKLAPKSLKDGDAAIGDTYCALVRDAGLGDELLFDDVSLEARFPPIAGSPVVSYCGVLLRDEIGRPFGTLCHYDFRRCQAPSHDIELLRAAGSRLMVLLRDTPPT